MTSVLRHYAQRNTNSQAVVPEFGGIIDTGGPFFDLSGTRYYNLNFPTVQYSGGSFYVDLAGLDSSGNPLNLFGQLLANDNRIYNVNFILNVPKPASVVPNMEFTVYFKNLPYNSFPSFPVLTIGILSAKGAPYPYTLSPPAPALFAPSINPSITVKSDGTDYTITSSGPAGWLGPYLIGTLIASLP